MAASVSSALPPVRSISLPTRLNPNSLRIEGELNKLRKWGDRVSSSSKTEPLEAETIKTGLLGLARLYGCVEGLVRSPASGHALLRHDDVVDTALDETVTLLDACSLGRDVVSTMTEQVRILQSGLRRKGDESSIRGHLRAYLSFRKKATKGVSKSLKALKQTQNKTSSVNAVQDQNYLVQVLEEVRNITISVLQSLVSFLSSPSLKNKLGGRSLISKIVPVGLGSSERRRNEASEIESVDLAVYGLHRQAARRNKDCDFEGEATAVQRKLEDVSRCTEGLEDGLDGVFKCLIRYRVSLLNVLNH